MRKIIIAANWKKYLNQEESVSLVSQLNDLFNLKNYNHQVMLFPDANHLPSILKEIENKYGLLTFGVQDPSFINKISDLLSDTFYEKISLSIVGHSDRRINHKEDNDTTLKKFSELKNYSGLCPVLCVGETEAQKNDGSTLDIIKKQIPENINSSKYSNECIIAYEPVWSIGTGKVPNNKEIETVLNSIKSLVDENVKLFYGGSVDINNVEKLLEIDLIDGFLIGGASTNFESLLGIIKKVDKFLEKTN